ncbi:hypothetical protein GCM10025858_02530 [Alicyclobacillus sacchari]|nr:hypothetical protein GCM10025858_02530 [Alicyclobacillus sacchari]
MVDALPKAEDDPVDEEAIRVAFIGRPNVGKSSLVNRLLGEQRVMVSDIAGTTRDAIDTPLVHDGQKYVLVDTAGVRRRGKVYENIEKYSVLRALRAIERTDVAFIVLDAERGIAEQDKRVAGYALDAVARLRSWSTSGTLSRKTTKRRTDSKRRFAATFRLCVGLPYCSCRH